MTADAHPAAMPSQDLRAWLAAAQLADEARELRADYPALLIVADGLRPGTSDEASETILAAACRPVVRSDRITDTYTCNATAIACLLSVGGEDLAGCTGPARLVREGEDHGLTSHNSARWPGRLGADDHDPCGAAP